jgi:plastocyanin
MRAHRFLPLVLTAVLAACQMGTLGSNNGGYSTGSGTGSMGGSTGMTPSMSIHLYSFKPQTDTVAAGTTVTWTNSDGVAHTVTSNASAFNSGNIAPAGTFSFTFTTAGTFPYTCTIHGMTGTIVVTP